MKTSYLARPDGGPDRGGRLPDWPELAAIVMERFWFGAAVALVVFLAVFFRMVQAVPYYRSTAVLMVDVLQPRLLNYQDVVAANVRNLDYFNTVINILHSQQMMETALEQSGLARHPGLFPEVAGTPAKASAALGLVSIGALDRTRLIHISVEHPDRTIASELANAMARAYIQQEIDNRMTVFTQAVDWLQERAAEYRTKLESGMLALQEYREEAQSVSLEEDQNIVIAKLKSLNVSLTAAQTERITVQSQWESIDNQITAEVSKENIAAQLQDPVLAAALTQLREQRQKVASLRQRYREDYPDLRDALQHETLLQAAYERAFDLAVYVVRSRYDTLRTGENNLRSALQDQEQEAFRLARQLVQYNDLKRNVEADQDIYESVITRMKEASLSETLPSDVIRIAEEARPGTCPVRPVPARTLVRGLVLALGAGIGVIFLLNYTDRRFRRNEDVERALGVPVLASLPIVAGRSIRERGLVTHQHPAGEVAESFRTLRAILEINPDAKNAKVLLVTSSQPSEGKSMIAVNFAISCAQDNRRTLLIGADLRRPAFQEIFANERTAGAGLTDVLSGTTPWREAMQPGWIPKLDILAAGSHAEHPAKLLSGKGFSTMLLEMRTVYDRIVIDAPPVQGASDTLLLLKQADGVLFVVRCGVTHSAGAAQAVKRIQSSGTACLGAVMNGIDLRSMANYYYYCRHGGSDYPPYSENGAVQAPDTVPRFPGAVVRRLWRWLSAKAAAVQGQRTTK